CAGRLGRQDPVRKLTTDPPDVMVGIGGCDSSNTTHLARICHDKAPTYHIEDASCVDPGAGSIRFRPVGAKEERLVTGWRPGGPLTVGVTAGASTPNNKIGETVERIAATRGLSLLR